MVARGGFMWWLEAAGSGDCGGRREDAFLVRMLRERCCSIICFPLKKVHDVAAVNSSGGFSFTAA